MDIKRLILSVSVCLGLYAAWMLTVRHIEKLHPEWAQPTTEPAPTTAPAVAVNTGAPPATTGPATAPVAPPAVAAAVGLHSADAPPSDPVTLGSAAHDDPAFPMAMRIDPRGAGLESVTLNKFYKSATDAQNRDPDAGLYQFQQPDPAYPDDTKPLATRSVTVDGTDVDLTGVRWARTAATADSATFTTQLLDGARPVLELTKTFKLQPHATDGSGGYDVAVAQTCRYLGPKAVTVSFTFNGPNPPSGENARSEDRRFMVGYDEGDQFIKTSDTFVSSLTTGKPPTDLVASKPLPLLWVGTCNSYFDAIVHPDAAGRAGAPPPPVHIASAPAVGTDYTTPEGTVHNGDATLVTNAFTLAPGAVASLDVHAFFGPKQRSLLKNAYYSAFPRAYNSTLVYTSGFCGFLTFNWLIDALYGILYGFHWVTHDWGLAIIGLVILVRSCLHPITKRSQINMMGMSKMGPEIERLKKKYGDDKDGLNKAMMSVYKEQGMVPILGCLPMLLQTPIWLALWAALQSTFEIRQAPFLHPFGVHLTWIDDLSRPDELFAFASPIHLPFGYLLHSINILPVLLAGVFFVQQLMQPVPPNQTPEQEQQRKMMRWMSLLYPILFYVSPSGLNLYILTSTSIGIVESKIIRRHIKEREEAEKAGKIIVDAGPGRGTKRDRDKRDRDAGGDGDRGRAVR
jgi:YidC/Oxa1 family membrane protein insertase